jgi:8-oxo-dGTP pyrophosphatase MutT (NUDIX family)
MSASEIEPPTFVDTVWQTAYRCVFPLARMWWWLSRSRHEGALVAIHVDKAILLVQSSYRSAWSFPGGGVRHDETPEAAAQRELIEEIGLAVDLLVPVGSACGRWEGRRDHVHFFELRLERLPVLRPDNREIVATRLVPAGDLRSMALTAPVIAYLNGAVSPDHRCTCRD